MNLSHEFISELKKLAKKTVRCEQEDFAADDWFGGNFDDAYNGGIEDGEVMLAQRVLEEIGEEY
jgi:hypothetical protein